MSRVRMRFAAIAVVLVPTVLHAPRVAAGGYGWTISASDTDPYVHTSSAPLLSQTLYLWLACDAAVEGAASAEFGISCTESLGSFSPLNGFTNSGSTEQPRLTIPACPTGGPRLAGSFPVNYLLFAGAAVCIVPSSNGLNATTTCLGRVIPNEVIGFASDGSTPCNSGAALCVSTDVAVAVTASDPAPLEAAPFTLSVVARNLGPLAATGIEVENPVGSPLVFETASASQGGYNALSGLWTVGSLAAGDSATLALTVHAVIGSGGGAAVHRAERTASAPFDANVFTDTDSVSVGIVPLPRADIGVTVDAPPAALCEADSVVLSLVVSNAGPDDATGVEVTNALPSGLTPSGHTASQGSFDAGTGIWSVGDLASGANATLDLTAIVGPETGGLALRDVASVTAVAQVDTTNGNDADSTVVNVQAGATGAFVAVTGTMPGNPVTMTLNLDDDTDVTGVTLRHRHGGETVFTETAMTRTSPNVWEAAIDGADVGPNGLQCVAVVATPCVTVRVPATGYAGVRVRVTESATFTLPAGRFSLLGIPFEPDAAAILSVFDELAPYDTRRWRYGTWNGTTYGDGPGQAEDVAVGSGFWVYSTDETVVAASGWSTDLSGDFTIPLAPGWNQFANPFPFPVSFADITRPAGVDYDLVGYDGSGYVHEVDTLQPRQGYWLRNTTPGPLAIAIPPEPAAPAATAAAFVPAPADGEWRIEVTGTWARGRDAGNALGMRAGASDLVDAHDLLEAPLPPGDHLVVAFEDAAGRALHTDFRAIDRDGATWRILVRSSGPAQPYVLRCDVAAALPAGWSARLVDPSGAGVLDATDGATARGLTLAGPETAVWTLLAGTPQYLARRAADLAAGAPVPGRPTLDAAPNPVTSGAAVLSLVLPRADTGSLRVFDVRGRLVRDLFAGPLDAGLHRFTWDGETASGRAAPGVYFVRFASSDAEVNRKVVLRGR